jgi:hypothetical protein
MKFLERGDSMQLAVDRSAELHTDIPSKALRLSMSRSYKNPPTLGIKGAIGLDSHNNLPENLKRPGFSEREMQERVQKLAATGAIQIGLVTALPLKTSAESVHG